jgi:hypothetical protein
MWGKRCDVVLPVFLVRLRVTCDDAFGQEGEAHAFFVLASGAVVRDGRASSVAVGLLVVGGRTCHLGSRRSCDEP